MQCRIAPVVRITSVAIALLLAAACSGSSASTDSSGSGSPGVGDTGPAITSGADSSQDDLGVTPSVLSELEECGNGELCGEVLASDGYPVRFRLVQAASSQPKAGLVALHFGGPGTNARESISHFAPIDPEQDMLSRFDLVGVEQRGTDAIEGVDCGNDALLHQLNIGEAAPEDLARIAKEWISGCPVGSFGTVTAAEDIATVLRYLDAGRTVFVGYSYGGVIGVLLGSDHADTVDAIVLDSPGLGRLDPRGGLEQTKSFSRALNGFFHYCDQGGNCTFAPDGNAEGRFRSILDSYEPPRDLLFAMAQFLYSYRRAPELDFILTAALEGDYSPITLAADFYHERVGETYPPSGEVFDLVACADDLTDDTYSHEQFLADVSLYGPFGELTAKTSYDTTGICDYWPGERQTFELDLSDSDLPVLVVASTGDPAASWSYVKSFANTSLPQSSAVVVIHRFDHGLWRSGYECIDDAVDAFILDDTLPTIPTSDEYLECDPLGPGPGS